MLPRTRKILAAVILFILAAITTFYPPPVSQAIFLTGAILALALP